MSGAPSITGTTQFPNPPNIIGITMKKIITKACAVTITFHEGELTPFQTRYFPENPVAPGIEPGSLARNSLPLDRRGGRRCI
jgi:hypothetical protein